MKVNILKDLLPPLSQQQSRQQHSHHIVCDGFPAADLPQMNELRVVCFTWHPRKFWKGSCDMMMRPHAPSCTLPIYPMNATASAPAAIHASKPYDSTNCNTTDVCCLFCCTGVGVPAAVSSVPHGGRIHASPVLFCRCRSLR
jgi:hypothetical protein